MGNSTPDLTSSLQELTDRMHRSAASLTAARTPAPTAMTPAAPPLGATTPSAPGTTTVTAAPAPRSGHHDKGFVRAPAPQSSPFLESAAGLQRDTADRASLTELALACMQRAALTPPGTLVLVTLPERLREDSVATGFDQMAGAGLQVVVMGALIDRHVSEDGSRAHRVPLRKDDPLLREWNVVVVGATLRLAFLARAEGGMAMHDPALVYQWGVVRAGAGVDRAAHHLLSRVPHLRLSLPRTAGV